MADYSDDEVLRLLGGTAEQVARELKEFSRAAEILSRDHPRLIDEYPSQWVGVYGGTVAASAESLESLMALLRAKGVPTEHSIIRFIDKEERTLIL